MAINYEALTKRKFQEVRQTYGARECILYALGLGIGANSICDSDLRYVYERDLLVLPSMVVTLGYSGFWLRVPDAGIDWAKVLLVDQEIELSKALCPHGNVIGQTRVGELYDQGVGKGATLVTLRELVDGSSGETIATMRSTEYLRGAGGFGGPRAPKHSHALCPDRTPDAVFRYMVPKQAALIYRLSGDDNPLHVDPDIARSAGFQQPILHGLATFGIACRAIVAILCDEDPSRVRMMRGRFTATVVPGDTLRVELWRTGRLQGMFRVVVEERGQVALDSGETELFDL